MLIVVDKAKGMTSFDIIRALKRELGEKKIGHSGTLDPMASGLLLIGTDKNTKQLHTLTGLDKSYITTIDFSKNSDTWDLDYREFFEEYQISQNDNKLGILKDKIFFSAPNIDEIKKKLESIVPYGELPLTPFSAKKKDGKKLYELARQGQQAIENKTMKVNAYEILDYSFPKLTLKLDVGSGTYIRSIGYWLGQEFNLGGILTELRRIGIGDYDLEKIKLDKQGIFYIKKEGENMGELKFNYTIVA